MTIIGRGNGSSNADLEILLKYLKYNPETDKLEASAPVSTTLNSFYLGDYHKMSSGGENIFFTNLHTDINWYPMWGGLKDQNHPENQGADGVIAPSGRVYGEFFTGAIQGGPGDSGTVPFNYLVTELEANLSVYSLKTILMESLDNEKLTYTKHMDTIGGTEIYTQVTHVTSEPGDELNWHFDHPVEMHQGSSVQGNITKEDGTDLLVKASALAADQAGWTYTGRVFTDRDIAFKDDLHSVFITNVEALDVGTNVELIRAPEPNEEVVVRATSGSANVRIHVEWDRGTLYEGLITIEGNPVTNITRNGSTYTGTVDVLLTPETVSLPITRDGRTSTLYISLGAAPTILSATLSGVYPGTQTELKAGDQVEMTFTTDIPVGLYTCTNGLRTSIEQPLTVGTEHTVTLTVTNTTATLQELAQTFTVRAAAPSTPFTTTNTMSHNNLYPNISFGTITYPAGQLALKDAETATVRSTVLNADTYTYSSNGELSIPNINTYEDKVVARQAGTYNISNTNFSISANRAANNATSNNGTVVWIADATPNITINTPNHLRSGGNNGTIAQNHTITVSSNQRILNNITLDADIGTWQGTWSYLTTSFSRPLQIHDNDPKGTGQFSNLLVTNLAGRDATASGTYNCQGFVSRTLDIGPFDWQTSINVEFYESSNLVGNWDHKAGITYTSTTNRPQVDRFNLQPNGNIELLDKSATDSSSSTTHFTIEET